MQSSNGWILKSTNEELEETLLIASTVQSEGEKIWKKLDVFFFGSDMGDLRGKIEEYKMTSWRWYCILSWNLLFLIPKERFGLVYAHILPMSIVLNVDVLMHLFWYLKVNTVSNDELTKIYNDILVHLKDEDVILGLDGSTDYSLNKLFEKEEYASGRMVDSMVLAEDRVKLAKIITNRFENRGIVSVEYFNFDIEAIVKMLLSVVSFFIATRINDIYSVVEVFTSPEKYGDEKFLRQLKNKELDLMAKGGAVVDNPLLPVDEDLLDKIILTGDFSLDGDISSKKTVTTVEGIKTKISNEFTKTSTGEYEDIDGVMSELDRLATETGDDTIRDLYYFNESTGKFEWKE